MSRLRVTLFVAMCTLLCTLTASAGTSEEIQHLLDFIEKSGCAFSRNGDVHDARDARSHIERKYNYVKSRVSSAEDFIKYAATRSSLSGEFYTVDCGGHVMPSSDWLGRELHVYRESMASSSTAD